MFQFSTQVQKSHAQTNEVNLRTYFHGQKLNQDNMVIGSILL